MKSDNLMIRISPALKAKAKEQAAKEEKTLSEWVLDLIKIELAKKES